ncbi:MAG: hypothetical protein ACXVJE_19370 [Mucilaginibacter sp.]
MSTNETTFRIQAYSKKELASLYKRGPKTFKSWIKLIPDLGEYNGKSYTPAQVEKIVTHLGPPYR